MDILKYRYSPRIKRTINILNPKNMLFTRFYKGQSNFPKWKRKQSFHIPQNIILENDKIKNHCLAKSISDATWHIFTTMFRI